MQGEKIPYKMLGQDPFSTWMGIEILECEIGRCRVNDHKKRNVEQYGKSSWSHKLYFG